MRYAIISDVHANLEALRAVLKEVDRAGVDQIVCLGDVVGYNANPNECVAIIREREIPTICGNHDAVACGLEEPWGFNPIALSAAMWTRDQLEPEHVEWLRDLPESSTFEHMLAVHGAPGNRNTYLFEWEDVTPHLPALAAKGCTLCFFGHTHSPGIFSKDGLYAVDDDSKFEVGDGEGFFINPGSVGQPRDGDARASFGLMDTEKNEFQLVRVAYPIREAAERVIAAELPQFLAERLYLGR